MSVDTVQVRWCGQRQFTAWDKAGHGVVMDTVPEYGGEATGARPLEVFLYALAACTAMDVVSILEKKRQRFSGVGIEVTATQRDEHPKIYTRIELVYVVTGSRVSSRAVARAIELSEEQYCSVRGMIGPHVEIVTGYRIEGTSHSSMKEAPDA